MGFQDSSVGKESACSAGDPGSISGSGRSAGEGTGYPLQYSWACLAAQLIKNLPPMQEISVRSLDWEDALEKEKATHSSVLAWRIPRKGMATYSRILAWRIPWTEETGGLQSTGSQRARHDWDWATNANKAFPQAFPSLGPLSDPQNWAVGHRETKLLTQGPRAKRYQRQGSNP